MSSSLVWELVNDYKGSFDIDLKFALRKRYGDPVNHIFDSSDIPFLEGLAVAGIKEANDLVGIIYKHEEVLVKEVW
jgi:hypothetical protein